MEMEWEGKDGKPVKFEYGNGMTQAEADAIIDRIELGPKQTREGMRKFLMMTEDEYDRYCEEQMLDSEFV